MDELNRLAPLLSRFNEVGSQIAAIVGRPATTGHIGEFIASRIFDIELERSANSKALDGRFRSGPLAGKSINIKWYPKLESLDINPLSIPDFYLVMAGPRSSAPNSRNVDRPLVITQVFLFAAEALMAELRTRGVKVQTGTSVRREEWSRAEVYPSAKSQLYVLSETQRQLLALFSGGPVGT